MNTEKLFDQADTIVTDFITSDSTAIFKEIEAIMSGARKANRDHKRALCNKMNDWIDFLSINQPDSFHRYRVSRDGNIETFYPNDETQPFLGSGDPYGRFGNLG